MFDNLNLDDMQGMLKGLQEKASQMQEEANKKVYTAKSGGGMVELSINGGGEVVDLNIDESLLEDKDSLQILLMSCITDAFKMAEDDKKNSALSMMGNLGGMNPFGAK